MHAHLMISQALCAWLFLCPLSAETLSFMSYNLKNFLNQERYKDGELVRSKYKPQVEIEALTQIIGAAQPDVLGVCEIGTPADLELLQARLRQQQLDYPYLEYVRAADSVRHLALLSKHPITRSQSQSSLTYQIGPQTYPLRRGLLHVQLTIADQPLHLIGVHLKSKRPTSHSDQAIMRLKEAHLIRDQIDQLLERAPQSLVLVYGDLNDTYKSPPLSALKGNYRSPLYLKPLPLRDSHGLYWTHFWESERTYSTFDYILCSQALQKYFHSGRIIDSPQVLVASDHRPLIASFEIQ